MKKSLSFLIWGYYGVDNFGDEVMKDVIVDQLRIRFPNCRISIRCAHDRGSFISSNVRHFYFSDGLSYMAKNFFILKSILSNINVLIIGGGTIFISNRKKRLNGLIYYLLLIVIAKLMKKQVIILSVGIGNITGYIDIIFMRLIASLSRLFLIRDSISYNKLASIGIHKKLYKTGDIVALYMKDPVLKYNKNKKRNTLGVSLMPYYTTYEIDNFKDKKFINDMAIYFDWLVEEHSFNIKFFCMKNSDTVRDIEISQQVIKIMKNRHSCTINPYLSTFGQTILDIQSVDFFLGMRLHAIFYSLKCGIPTIGICVNPKIYNIMHEYSMESYSLDLDDISIENLKSITSSILTKDIDAEQAIGYFNEIYRGAEKNFDLLEGVVKNLDL